jgi:hypothetical protein
MLDFLFSSLYCQYMFCMEAAAVLAMKLHATDVLLFSVDIRLPYVDLAEVSRSRIANINSAG